MTRAVLESPSDIVVVADNDAEPEAAAESPSLSPSTTAEVPLPEFGERIESALPSAVLPALSEPLGLRPVSVSLPALGVDGAPIEQVGLELNGELEVPGAEAVGWYQFGAGVDAGRGSAVLAAHIAYNGRDGVFRNLADSAVGDRVEVEADGSTRTYEIVSIEQYGKFDLPIDDLFREDGDERLVMITCGGSFNPQLRSYDDNVVAIAVPLV